MHFSPADGQNFKPVLLSHCRESEGVNIILQYWWKSEFLQLFIIIIEII